MDCTRLKEKRLKTYIGYKVLWLQTDIVEATLSQLSLPGAKILLIVEIKITVEETMG